MALVEQLLFFMDLVLALYYAWINFAHKQAIADYKVGRLVTFNWTHSFKVILRIFKAIACILGCSHNSTIHLVMQEDRVAGVKRNKPSLSDQMLPP